MNNIEVAYSGSFLDEMVKPFLVGYYSVHKNTISWNFSKGTFWNSGVDIVSIGTELGVDFSPIELLDLGLKYGFSKPIDSHDPDMVIANDNNTWRQFPAHQLSGNVGVNIQGFTAGLLMKFRTGAIDERFESSVNDELIMANAFILDANIGYTLHDRLRFWLKADQLLHNDYQYIDFFAGSHISRAGFRPRDGMILSGGIEASF